MTIPNALQVEAWNGVSGERWVADADRRDAVLAPVADVLLAAAAIEAGEHVLDVGCGCGVTTIAAASACAPGRAVGLDLSGPMLDLARSRAAGTPASFLQADAQTHALDAGAFDVVISRFGTMFFDDPVAAFANLAGAVRPGGRLCLATWQPLEANDWLAVPSAVLLQYGALPDTAGDEPGMFAQADPASVASVLGRAGWADVEVGPVSLSLLLGRDGGDATDYVAGTGIAHRVLDPLPPADRDEAIAAIASLLDRYAGPEGVGLGAGINVITARRP